MSHESDAKEYALGYKIQAYFDHVKSLPAPQAQRPGAPSSKVDGSLPKSKRAKITETTDEASPAAGSLPFPALRVCACVCDLKKKMMWF
jgi:hypothetical protein